MRRIILFTVLSNLLFGGYTSIFVSNPLSFNKVGSEIWGMGGAGVAHRGVPGIELLNPAGLKISGYSIMLDVGYQGKEDYHGDDFSVGDDFIIPQFISIAAGNKYFSGSAGFYHKFHQNIDFGKIPITTAAGPTGNYCNSQYVYDIYTYFLSSSYSFYNRLSVGTTVFLDYYRNNAELINVTKKGYTYSSSTLLGFNFRLSNKMSWGVSASLGDIAEMTVTQKYSSPVDTLFEEIDVTEWEYIFQFSNPWIINTGLLYESVPDLKFSLTTSYYEWSKVRQTYSDSEFIPIAGLVNLGFDWQVDERLSIQGGAFHQLYQCGKYEEKTHGFTFGLGFEPIARLKLFIYSIPWRENTYTQDIYNYIGPWGEVTRFMNFNLVYSFGSKDNFR